MPKFLVTFSINRLYAVEVNAADEREAEDIVEDGNAEYDESNYISEEPLGVNTVERM